MLNSCVWNETMISKHLLTLSLTVVLIGGGVLLNRWLGDEAMPPAATAAHSGPTLAAALALPRPTLVEFGMDSCASCRAMQHQLTRLRQAYPETLQVVSINLMEQRALAEQWRIRAMPTQVLLDADGNEVDRHLGFISAEALRERFAAAGVALGEPVAEL
jgi:thioredoxin 1